MRYDTLMLAIERFLDRKQEQTGEKCENPKCMICNSTYANPAGTMHWWPVGKVRSYI